MARKGDQESQEPKKYGYERRGGRIGVRAAHEEGQVGYGSRHGQLEQRLGLAEIAGLANPQLGQASDPVLGRLAPGAVVPERRAGLEGARCLEQGFLGMDRDAAAIVSTYTLHAQRTGLTHRGGEVEDAAPVLGRSEI